MSDEVLLPIPNLQVPQQLFILSNPSLGPLHAAARASLIAAIEADEMGPYCATLQSANICPIDDAALSSIRTKNTAKLVELDAALVAAEKTEGETEISDALKARANYLTQIGDKDGALAAQRLALEKSSGVGSKIDIVLTFIRIGFFFGDYALVQEYLDRADALVQEGGDWDRLNRLKVYRGLYLLGIRQFRRAADLFVEALSTFTATELLSYTDFVALTTIAGAVSLSRVELKKKIINAPEVLQVLPELPVLSDLISSLYACDYAKFFQALAATNDQFLMPSRVLSPHRKYYVREMRIVAYSQVLESYASLTLKNLSERFGVSEEFIENDLLQFIAGSPTRLHCTIDSVNGIVSTTRPPVRTKQLKQLLRSGDSVLDGVQRLGRGLY
ncbi:PCI-domain-containing protein [Fistulina hepatica ATCC 64428]|uniref:PCI-domain-containing protein n=1 Tax=Fistulina hepatica ATCC 64428 TaxID=1128425 RepID=A0A0D7AFA1_9AGAR|nr:PCI-domain-containing protein [Fistulina hepatica ATCC 64428]